jgi:hypothetical protein
MADEMAKWRWGADGGRCAETRQRARLRDGRPPGTTGTTRTTTRTTPRLGAPGRVAQPIPGAGRRRQVVAGCCRGWSVGLRAPHPNGLRRRAWPGPVTRLAAAPRNPASQHDSTVAPLCSLLAARCPRCCPFSHSCRQAALRSQNYKPCPSQPACSCSALACSCASGTRQPPTPSLSPVTFRLSPFAFRLSPFALRLAPCATLPLRPLPSTLLRCRPCPFQPAPLLKH